MLNIAKKDIGALLTATPGGFVAAITAGGSGDATEYSGPWTAIPEGVKSVKVLVLARATLTAAATMSLIGNLQDATDSSGTGAADYGTLGASAVLMTGAVTNGQAIYEMDFCLDVARGYIRAQVTPDLSASGTDTAVLAIAFVWGVDDRGPYTNRKN